MGDTYHVRTPPTVTAERRVADAAVLLSQRMESIGQNTKEISSLRLAVMAGLDLATELITLREKNECERADESAFRRAVRQRTDRLLELVDEELRARAGPDRPSGTER